MPTFKQVEDTLSHDMDIVQNFLKRWRLRLLRNKTISSAFHVRNHQVNKQLKICVDQQQIIKYEPTPKCLGINMDRSLTFKYHIEQLKCKVSATLAEEKSLSHWLSDWLAQNGEHLTEVLEFLL